MSKNYHNSIDSQYNIKRNIALNIFQVLFLSILFVDKIKADLPVHCLRENVIGPWTLRISKKQFSPSLEDEKFTSCGHGFPNKVVNLDNDSDLNIPDYHDVIVDLAKDFKVYEDNKEVGNWSFVYDQSFIIYYKQGILTAPFKYYKKPEESTAISNCSETFLGWFIPSKDKLKDNWSCFYGFKGGKEDKKTNDKKYNFLQIEMSFESKNQQNIKEFIEKNINQVKTQLDKLDENDKKANKDMANVGLAQKKETENLEKYLRYEHMSKIVEKLNKLKLGWSADIHPEFVGMSFAELKHNLGLNKGKYSKKNVFEEKTSFIQISNTKADSQEEESGKAKVEEYLKNLEEELSQIKDKEADTESNTNQKIKKETLQKENSSTHENKKMHSKKSSSNSKTEKKLLNKKGKKTSMIDANQQIQNHDSQQDQDSKNVSNFDEIIKYLKTDIKDIDENKLSKNWDWRNVGGVNYVPPVRAQGSCGSCYIFSTMSSLESRLRIQTNNKDQTIFSKQYPISCNFYSEGCDGGFPILVAKFLNEFEIVPESCFEYTATNDKCSNVCDYQKNKKRYTVNKYGYLGGAYSKTSEADMMKEIRARGPIPGNIMVHWSFHYYKNGIFSSKPLKKNSGKISKSTLIDSGRDWAKVEHSITLVGYGEEDGVKYWIGMNTWGSKWGEDGFFRILRGENEEEIETMGDYMNVKVEDRF